MKELKESLLDKDFDISGVEYIYYDWMNWRCLEDIAVRIHICNEYIYANSMLPIIDKFQQEILDDFKTSGEVFSREYTKSMMRELAADINRIQQKITGFGNSTINNMSSRVKMFKIVDELLSMPCGKIFKRVRNDDVQIAISNINERETPILKIVFWENISDNDVKILSNDIDNLCKKHKFKYETNEKTRNDKTSWSFWWNIYMTV